MRTLALPILYLGIWGWSGPSVQLLLSEDPLI